MESTQAQNVVEPAVPQTTWNRATQIVCLRCGEPRPTEAFFRWRQGRYKQGPYKTCADCSRRSHEAKAADRNGRGTHMCRQCFATKSLTEFSKAKSRPLGIRDWCRACVHAYATTASQRAKDRARHRERMTNPEKQEQRRAYFQAYAREYRKNPIYQRQRDARLIINLLRRHGWLKPQPCQECGDTKVQAHHPDYDRPLDVIWLCRPCHVLEHHPLPVSR